MSCNRESDPADQQPVQAENQEEGEFDFTPAVSRGATSVAEGAQLWLLEALDDDAVLIIEIYEEFGGPTSPGVVDITEKETSYATCSTCIALLTGCTIRNGQPECERTFMPRAEGQMRLDAIGASPGERLSGEVGGLVFQEVSIGEDFQTEVVDAGQTLELDSWSFDIQLDSLDGSGGPDEVCGGHGHLHGSHCHCDPGYRIDPMDPTRCIPG